MEKRNKPMSSEQKNILIEFMRSHPELKGKFTSSFTRQDSICLWKDITNILNATPGATKEWKEWRKSWHDVQSRTKNKKAQINFHTSGTGGGPPIADLSESDEKILDILGETAIRGLLGVVEPQTEEIQLDGFEMEINLPNEPTEGESSNDIRPIKERKTKPRNVATQRLNKAVEQNDETITLLKKKIIMKKNYYKKKIAIMERNAKANENIVSELKELQKILLHKLINE